MRLFSKIILLMGGMIIPVFSSGEDIPSEEEIRRLQMDLSRMNVRMADPSALQQQRLLQRELFEKTRALTEIKIEEKRLIDRLTPTLGTIDLEPDSPHTDPTPQKSEASVKNEEPPPPAPPLKSEVAIPLLTESQVQSLSAVVLLWRSRDLYKAIETWKLWLKENQRPDLKRENDLALLTVWVAQRATDSSFEYSNLEKHLLDAAKEQQNR